MGIYKGGFHPAPLQRMREKIIGSAIQHFGGYNVIPGESDVLNSVSDGCRPGGCRQSRCPSFQRRHTFLKDIRRWVGQPGIHKAIFRQPEPCRRLGTVFKHKRCGLINRHRPGASGRIRQLLPSMKLQRLKSPVFCHCFHPQTSISYRITMIKAHYPLFVKKYFIGVFGKD